MDYPFPSVVMYITIKISGCVYVSMCLCVVMFMFMSDRQTQTERERVGGGEREREADLSGVCSSELNIVCADHPCIPLTTFSQPRWHFE